MNSTDISTWGLAAAYLLLAFPLGALLWLRVPIVGQTCIAVVRMTAQLLFVGFYLRFLFANVEIKKGLTSITETRMTDYFWK